MLGKLGSPCDDGRHQCGVERLLRTRGWIVRIYGRVLRHVHVQTCAEVRRVEEWEARVHNLEVDLDQVKRKSNNERRAVRG